MTTGVLDSGVGGLTILMQLRKRYPQSNFIYLADHAFCPYGTKPAGKLKERVVDMAKLLVTLGATNLLFACNTASLFAKEAEQALSVRVSEVITPTAQAACRATKNKKIALVATRNTIRSGAYRNIFAKNGVSAYCADGGELVTLAENAAPKSERLRCVQKILAANFGGADVLVLGCTHFPLFIKYFRRCWKGKIVCSRTDLHPQRAEGKVRYFTTGDAAAARKAAAAFGDVPFEKILP